MNFRILLFWVVVAVPLTWGVLQSVNAALPLFGMKSVYIPGLTVPPLKPPIAVPTATVAPAPVATPAALTTPGT